MSWDDIRIEQLKQMLCHMRRFKEQNAKMNNISWTW
jgi:hypothetical protein